MYATEVLGLIAGVLVLLGVLGRMAWGFYRMLRRIEKAGMYVESEMRLNGGTTTRDAIHRIELHCNQVHDLDWDGLDRRTEGEHQ